MWFWSTALGINTCIWVVLGTLLVYSFGTLILFGAWHQFLWVLILFALCNCAMVAMATQA